MSHSRWYYSHDIHTHRRFGRYRSVAELRVSMAELLGAGGTFLLAVDRRRGYLYRIDPNAISMLSPNPILLQHG